MDFWNAFASLFSNFGNLTWQMVVMWGIGALLIYLAIAKKMEPSLLLPMGFGAILVNLPLSGAITQGDTVGPISALFEAGMSNELFPLLLFIGIGAMIDFGPLLEKPWLMLFGAAAQFGIFFTLFLAGFFFDLKDAASIAVIGDWESVMGFRALGLDTYPVTSVEEARKTVHDLAKTNCAVIYLTETLAKDMADVLDRYKDDIQPAIILIPGREGSLGIGKSNIQSAIERAVGADIL